MEVDGLTRYRFPESDLGREVVRVGDPASMRTVVLLHELGGLSQPTVDYARRLVESGCAVHMPVIFGSIGQQSPAKGIVQLCWGRQLTLFLSNRRSRLADWLAEFSDRLSNATGHPIVVIGMCATGGVVFSVLMRESVAGAVAAQPSLPFRPPWVKPTMSSLGATTVDVIASAESGKPLTAMRYQKDLICPAGRLLQVEETFGHEPLRRWRAGDIRPWCTTTTRRPTSAW